MGPHQARLLEGYLGRKQGVLLFCGMDQDDIESNLYACGKRIASPEKHLLCVSDKRGTWDTIGDQLVSDGDPAVMEKLLDLSFQHSPDVLLVGPVETRGQFERIFAQALKGTLVLAHTYARDTADALVQLLSMGLPPHLMGSALLGIISQRNLRLLCPHCQIEDARAKDFVEQLSIPSAMLPPSFYSAKGCDQCLKTGYDRDTNLFEFLEMSDELRSQLEPGLKIESIRTMLKSNGMLTLRQLAIHKAVNGQTALSEVIRVSP
jgi:type II secretory ATPase GspE/PulE/Tfp pilus assembly ATPase PilB-like protein